MGGVWETKSSQSVQIEQEFAKFCDLIPYEIVNYEMWNYAMPFWVEAIIGIDVATTDQLRQPSSPSSLGTPAPSLPPLLPLAAKSLTHQPKARPPPSHTSAKTRPPPADQEELGVVRGEKREREREEREREE